MWKLWNKLFGWDYIYWTNSADQGVARIMTDFEGNPFYIRYRLTKVIDRIKTSDQVMWLTCKPSKYLK